MAAKKRDKRKQKAPYPMQGQRQPPERLCEAGLAYQRDELDTAYALATNVLLATASTPPSQTRVQNLLADICRHQVAGTPSSVRWLELLNSAVARTPRQPHLLFRRVLEYWRSGAGPAVQKYLRAVAVGEPTKPDDALSQVMGRADFKWVYSRLVSLTHAARFCWCCEHCGTMVGMTKVRWVGNDVDNKSASARTWSSSGAA